MAKRALIISGIANNASAERGIETAKICGYTDTTLIQPVYDKQIFCYGVPDYMRNPVLDLAARSSEIDTLFIYVTAHGDADKFKMQIDKKERTGTTVHGHTQLQRAEIGAASFKNLIGQIKYKTRIILVSNCSGESFLEKVIDGDKSTIGIASLGAGEVKGHSSFNPILLEKIQAGLSIKEAYSAARAHVVYHERNTATGERRRPYLYYPESFPTDFRF